jgi:integrase/recombinase XerD
MKPALNQPETRSEGVNMPPDNRSDLSLINTIIRHSQDPEEPAVAVLVEQPLAVPRQAETDAQLIGLWLHGRSIHTQRAYRADIDRFMRFVAKPLHHVTLGNIQGFADALEGDGLQPASRHRLLSAVKSLFAFGHRLGYLPFDVARPLKLQAFRDGLSERILSEGDVQRMLALESDVRNRTIILTLYASGVRVSELSGMRWGHLSSRENGGQVSVFGKRGKTRSILLPPSVWAALLALREMAGEDAPVFKSRKGGALICAQISRIVKRAAKKAGIPKVVTSHWLRHAHASHALDRSAPIHLVQQTLGHSSVSTTGKYLHARPSESSSGYLPL